MTKKQDNRGLNALIELVAVSLENFQSIARHTRIPLAKLNLLYGPNSAGKGALLDAMTMLEEFLDSRRTESTPVSALPDRVFWFGRNWRYRSGMEHAWASGRFALGVEVLCPRELVTANLLTSTEALSIVPESKLRIAAEFSFSIPEDIRAHKGDPALPLSIDIALDGVEFYRFREHEELSIKLTNSFIKEDYGPLLDRVRRQPGTTNAIVLDGDWAVIRGAAALESTFDWDVETWRTRTRDVNEVGKEAKPAPEAFVALHNRYVPAIVKILSRSLASSRVSPSRSIPESEDVTYLMDVNGARPDPGLDEWAGTPLPMFRGAPEHEALASSGARKEWRAIVEKLGGVPRPIVQPKDTKSSNDGLVDRVNQALSDHLLLDRSYQVVTHISPILSSSDFLTIALREPQSEIRVPVQVRLVVRLMLRDSEGRLFRFEDVGSGISYVLPVLSTIFQATNSTALIEQPELHLHPALQAALGDVFVEAANEGRTLVIESHSEHLLLRILRRIRQTAAFVPIGPSLQLSPQDVSVLYFNPKPDGTTEVTRLRVTADGDFMDRWPRGFFAERDQELFDDE